MYLHHYFKLIIAIFLLALLFNATFHLHINSMQYALKWVNVVNIITLIKITSQQFYLSSLIPQSHQQWLNHQSQIQMCNTQGFILLSCIIGVAILIILAKAYGQNLQTHQQS